MSFFLIFRIFNFSVGLESPQLDLSSSAHGQRESVSIRSCVYVHTWYGNICSTHLWGNKNQNFQDSPWFGICTACCLRRPPVRRTTVRATTLFANSFPTSRPSACSGSRTSRTPPPWLKPPSASFHWTPAKMMISIIIIASRYRSSRPAKRQNYKGRKEEKNPRNCTIHSWRTCVAQELFKRLTLRIAVLIIIIIQLLLLRERRTTTRRDVELLRFEPDRVVRARARSVSRATGQNELSAFAARVCACVCVRACACICVRACACVLVARCW